MYIKVLPKGYLGLLDEETELMCVDYNEIHLAVDFLARKIRHHSTPILQIYPISKGGDMPAVRLSHVLDEMNITHNEADITDDTFVLDEIIHSGKTIVELKERLKKKKVRPVFGALFVWEDIQEDIVDYLVRRLQKRNGKKCPVKLPWETEKSALLSFLRSEKHLREVGA